VQARPGTLRTYSSRTTLAATVRKESTSISIRLDAAGSARVFGNIIDFDQTGATTSPNPGLWVKSMQHKADFCCAENNQVLHYYVTAWGSGVKLDENCATSDCRQ